MTPIMELTSNDGRRVVEVRADGTVLYRGVPTWCWAVFHLAANAIVAWAVCTLAVL